MITSGSALVTLYLLTMSWIVVIASLSSCNRLSDDTQTLQFASVIQGYAILAFAFAILATADSFGYSPGCNQNALVVIFRPFSALRSGRIFGWIVVGLVFLCYTGMTVRDYTAKVLKRIRARQAARKRVNPSHEAPVPQYNASDFASHGATHAPPLTDMRALREKVREYLFQDYITLNYRCNLNPGNILWSVQTARRCKIIVHAWFHPPILDFLCAQHRIGHSLESSGSKWFKS
jgi:hypothetical protein